MSVIGHGRPTALGSLYVINRTRFATDDLMEVVNKSEAFACRTPHGRPKLSRGLCETTPVVGRQLASRITGVDGAVPIWFVEHHAPLAAERWRNASGTVEHVWPRWVVPSDDAPEPTLRLVAPEYIPVSPLEALLHAAGSERLVPRPLVRHLLGSVNRMFEMREYPLGAAELRVRILPRRMEAA